MHSETSAAPRRRAGRKRSSYNHALRETQRVSMHFCRDSVLKSPRTIVGTVAASACAAITSSCASCPSHCSVRIDVRVEDANLLRPNRDRRRHRESRPPRTLLPRQIDSRHILNGKRLNSATPVSPLIVQIDRLFKVEPPLPLDRRDAARNSGRSVGPVHSEFCREFFVRRDGRRCARFACQLPAKRARRRVATACHLRMRVRRRRSFARRVPDVRVKLINPILRRKPPEIR